MGESSSEMTMIARFFVTVTYESAAASTGGWWWKVASWSQQPPRDINADDGVFPGGLGRYSAFPPSQHKSGWFKARLQSRGRGK